MQYIIVMRDTKFWLVGPFDEAKDATEFGKLHYAPGGPDDPRWQTIDLPYHYSAVGAVVYLPDRASKLNDTNILDNFRI